MMLMKSLVGEISYLIPCWLLFLVFFFFKGDHFRLKMGFILLLDYELENFVLGV